MAEIKEKMCEACEEEKSEKELLDGVCLECRAFTYGCQINYVEDFEVAHAMEFGCLIEEVYGRVLRHRECFSIY